MSIDGVSEPLPAHVYVDLASWEASPEHNDGGVRPPYEETARNSLYKKIACQNVLVHREEYQLHAWSSEVMDAVCLWCHPEYATRHGVLILSWLTEERREHYLALLGVVRAEQATREQQERQQRLRALQQRAMATRRVEQRTTKRAPLG